MQNEALIECIVFLEKVNMRISIDYEHEVARGKKIGLISSNISLN